MTRSIQILMLYRHILRAAQRFPSIKREQVLAEIKQEFHKNKAGWAGVGRRLQSGA